MGVDEERPDSARDAGGYAGVAQTDHDTPYLSAGERRLLEAGKHEHKETTATARRALQARVAGRGLDAGRCPQRWAAADVANAPARPAAPAPPPPPAGTYRRPSARRFHALQLAEKTADVAHNTLVELHRQGEQLENAEIGMDQVRPSRVLAAPAVGGAGLGPAPRGSQTALRPQAAAGRQVSSAPVACKPGHRARTPASRAFGLQRHALPLCERSLPLFEPACCPAPRPRSLPRPCSPLPANPFEQVQGDIKEASTILKFMRRWCCFQVRQGSGSRLCHALCGTLACVLRRHGSGPCCAQALSDAASPL